MFRTGRRLLLLLALVLASALPLHAGSVTVAWDPNPEPGVRYTVYWGTQHLVYNSSASASTTTSYVVSGLTAGQTYYFAVQAVSADGLASPFSDEVTVTLSAPPTSVLGTPEPDTNWRIVARADFNGDGKTDVVWRNSTTGENRVWYLNGDAYLGSASINGLPDPNWDIAAAGDFDRDGKPDLIWRNRLSGANLIWYMDGANFVRAEYLQSMSDPQWAIVGIGDFNDDGCPDLLWRHAGTGENAIWYMDREVTLKQEALPRIPDPNWQVVAVDDFTLDGHPDLVWWNRVNGQTVLWEMQGAVELAYSTIDSVPDTSRRPVASGDFDSDGRPELLWRNATGGTELRKVAALAQLISPAPDSILRTSTATFAWSSGSGVLQTALYVGTTAPGSYDIYNAYQGTNLVRTVPGLPSTGKVYVRLWSRLDTGWRYADYSFKANADASLAELAAPAVGSVLTGPSAAFTWTAGKGVSNVALYVGTRGPGSYDIYSGYNGTSLTQTVSGLPTTGIPIYVRLWSQIARGWQCIDYTYNANPAPAPAELVSPAPGNTLAPGSATFRWTSGSEVSQVALYVGTTGAGSYDLYYGYQGTSLSKAIAGLPATGTIYVRLWSRLPTGWQSMDYSYTVSQ